MISSAEEYEYVTGADVDEAHPHGDLDRILIDGEIMPLRTGDTDKTDRNGKAIPRTKIMRGEDIAFLLEAVYQRYYSNWWTERVIWYWMYSSATGTTTKVVETGANDRILKGEFSRKVSAKQLNDLWDMLDRVCDDACHSLDFEEKVSDYGKTFEEVYGSAGVPVNMRIHSRFPPPAYGDALQSADHIAALFVMESYLECAYFGRDLKVHKPGNRLDFDFEVEGDKDLFIDDAGNYYSFNWKVSSVKKLTRNDDGSALVHKSGTGFGYPKPDFEFFRVRAPHVSELLAVICVHVHTLHMDGNFHKLIWLPITATKDGEWFSLTAGACGFSTKASVVSLCEKSGFGVPDAPSLGDDSYTYSSQEDLYIGIDAVRFLGRWDDHTKWR